MFNMKRLLLILILTLSFQSWTKADDIRDFEIEGMSIGDSLLDYMSEDEINMNDLKLYRDDQKYYEIEYVEKKDIFEGVSIVIKRNDKKYKIYALRGAFITDDKKTCLKKRDEIVKDIKNLLTGVYFHEDNQNHYFYKDSKQYIAQFTFQPEKEISEHIRVECLIPGKKSKKIFPNTLNLVIQSYEFEKWLSFK